MTTSLSKTFTAFEGHRRLASGRLDEVALFVKRAIEGGTGEPVLTYDDVSGRSIDFDTRGTDAEVVARLRPAPSGEAEDQPADEPRGRGRPKLGVIAREVTLLPRHWEWLNAQPGGASVALRKLVEDARRAGSEKDRIRQAHEAAYHFMSAMAGDLAGFEEATRALFANDHQGFNEHVATWPEDIRSHATRLGFAHGD